MTCIDTALVWGRDRLADAGISSASLDARLLLREALGLSDSGLISRSRDTICQFELKRYGNLIARRENREPVARIVGRKEFWGLDLEVNPDVLVPRPESEILVETAIALHRQLGMAQICKVCDLGTGSGALLIAILSELQHADGVGLDISGPALRVARRNADLNNVGNRAQFQLGDLTTYRSGRFDVIACNPPYVASCRIESLDPEVRDHDPMVSLDGGVDGLQVFRDLATTICTLLTPAGIAVVEIGAEQENDVRELFQETGNLVVHAVLPDLAGIPRALVTCHEGMFAKLQQYNTIEKNGQKRLGNVS